MDPELLEKFFVAYLRENKLKYAIKGRVYTVKLDKTHEKWYDCKELVVTFDPGVAKKNKKAKLIGHGTFIFDSMVTRYSDDVIVSNLKLPSKEDDILEVNEQLSKVQKDGTLYGIEDMQGSGSFILFEVTIKTVHKRERIKVPLLMTEDQIFSGEGFEKGEFELVKEEVRTSKDIERGLEHIPTVLHETIEELEKEHYKDNEELIRIQEQHASDQYEELQRKEGEAQWKIDDAKEKAVSGSTFAIKNKWMAKQKELKRKYEELVEKHKTKRDAIKEQFDKQMIELKARELNVEAKLLTFAKVEFPMFTVDFDDGEGYYYIPVLKKFFKREKQPTKKEKK